MKDGRRAIPGPSAEDKLHARLLSYLDLMDDWDGYGAALPSIDAVLDAVDFLVMRPRDANSCRT